MTHSFTSISDRSTQRLFARRIVLLLGSAIVPIAVTGCGTGTNESAGDTSRQASAITNGTVDTAQVPNVAFVGLDQSGSGCTGTLIAGQWVLTAAHCANFYNSGPNQTGIPGMTFSGPGIQSTGSTAVFNMAPQLVPFTNDDTKINPWGVGLDSSPAHDGNSDVALVMLAAPIADPTTNTITSVVTLASSPPPAGSPVTTWGFGDTVRPNPSPYGGPRNYYNWTYSPPDPPECSDYYDANCSKLGTYPEIVINPGDSGGPSYTGSESIFAVNSSSGSSAFGSTVGDAASYQPELCGLMYNRPHRFCQTGAPLGGEPAGCAPFVSGTNTNITTAVLNQDQYCGTDAWDEYCVNEAAAMASDMDMFTCWAKKGSTYDGYSDILLSGNFGGSLPVALSNGDGSFYSYEWDLDDATFGSWATTSGVTSLAGDFDGDGFNDVALVSTSASNGWGSIPLALEQPLPLTYHVTNTPIGGITGKSSESPFGCGGSTFAGWATCPGTRPVVGDFDGDGKADIALVGSEYFLQTGNEGSSVPVAFSNGDGSFRITVTPDQATNPGKQAGGNWSYALQNSAVNSLAAIVAGDFDGDGRTDIAAVGGDDHGQAVSTIAVGFSNGDGTFRSVYIHPAYTFLKNALWTGAHVVAGDFDGNGLTELALVGGSGWTTIPMLSPNGNTANFAFTYSNNPIDTNFAGWASQTGVLPVLGDFDGNGMTDIAITGGYGWSSIPVAFSTGGGNFSITNSPTDDSAGVSFPNLANYWSSIPLGASY